MISKVKDDIVQVPADDEKPIPSPSHTNERTTITKLFKQKNYRQALTFIEAELSKSNLSLSYKNWLHRQLPTIHTTWGWELIQAQKCEEAIAFFEKALIQNQQPYALKGLGLCSYRRQDFWQSELYLRKFLSSSGFELDGFLLLIDSLESLLQFDTAQKELEMALARPKLSEENRQILSKRLASMQEKNRESHHQTTITGTYIALTYRAFEHQDLGPWALDIMERAIDEFSLNFSIPRPELTIEVVLYASQSFRKLAYTPLWVSGLFDGRIRIPVPPEIDQDNLKRTLRHELTHALLTNISGNHHLPTWFHEGLATFLECSPFCMTTQNSVSRGQFLPIGSLEKSFFQLDPTQVRQAYHQSYYLLKTILKLEGKEGIRRIIENIRPNQESSSHSLLHPLDLDFEDVYRLASSHWINGQGL